MFTQDFINDLSYFLNEYFIPKKKNYHSVYLDKNNKLVVELAGKKSISLLFEENDLPNGIDDVVEIVDRLTEKNSRDFYVPKYFDEYDMEQVDMNDMIGATLSYIRVDKDKPSITFVECNGKRVWVMKHKQECCEQVDIAQIDGEFDDLKFTPIVISEKIVNDNRYGRATFFKLATIKGYVTIRWFGEFSAYSEDVDLYRKDIVNTKKS